MDTILAWTRRLKTQAVDQLAGWVGGCVRCGTRRSGNLSPRLCPSCTTLIEGCDRHRCSGCAIPLTSADLLCLECIQHPPPLNHLYAFASYQGLMQQLIVSYKLHQRLSYGPLLSDLLTHALSQTHLNPNTLIVPIPQTDESTHQRGFVPLIHLFKSVRWDRIGLSESPIAVHALKRLHHDHLQIHANAAQRQKQVKGAFIINQDISHQRILLIDDVYTTSATLNEAARVCIAGGAASVRGVVLARGELKKPTQK